MGFIKKNIWFLVLIIFVLSFFWQFIIKGLLPIPSDTIVGLYHPFRDAYAKDSPRGIPYKNFLITDPIRQIIPWKSLSVDSLSHFQLPLWNPYEMAGKPLLANFQSSPFYPLNILLFIKPFSLSWSVFILLQPLMGAYFMYLYLKNLKLNIGAITLGSFSFALSGFSISWLEWGNVLSAAIWLPLILFSIDKIFSSKKYKWVGLLTVALICSFLAGYLQIFFYIGVLSAAYYALRWFTQNAHPTFGKIITSLIVFIIITAVQWIPTLQFITLSARYLDQNPLTSEGWFIPYQHLIQFVVPDFFGNPATLNYWGVWNYAEFAGYVGIVVLFFAVLSLFIKKQKEVFFFLGVILVALVFATPNFIATLPFTFSIPFLNSAQPTRIIFLIVFSLCILGSFGFDHLLKRKFVLKEILIVVSFFSLLFLTLWLVVLSILKFNITPENLMVAKHNSIFPTLTFVLLAFLVLFFNFARHKLTTILLIIAIVLISFFDLTRYGLKFTPFTPSKYFYPNTKTISFLKNQKGVFRIAATDSRILAPNIATYYKLQSIEGYDPLYLYTYAQLIASSERSDHSIKPPFGFNRIITPHNFSSPIINLLNVKYVLSFSELGDKNFTKVFEEGQTKIYQNKNALSRAFFVKNVNNVHDFDDQEIKQMFIINLADSAIVQRRVLRGKFKDKFSVGQVKILSYSENKVVIKTDNIAEGFLVLTDSYYPTWKATIDGMNTPIYKTDFSFRGIVVPAGTHTVEFKNSLL